MQEFIRVARYFVALASMGFTSLTSAISVTGTLTEYNDPNNYLGLTGLPNIGDEVEAEFNILSAPSFSDSFPLPPGTGAISEYVFFGSEAASDFAIEGISVASPNPTGAHSSRIFNDVSFIFGTGNILADDDSYVFSEFYDSPLPQFSSLIWAVILIDTTGAIHADDSFYVPSDIVGFDLIQIRAFLFDANTQSEQTLLLADVQPVPVPASIVFFASGILGLFGMKRKSARIN